jgi:hypothetical protein
MGRNDLQMREREIVLHFFTSQRIMRRLLKVSNAGAQPEV